MRAVAGIAPHHGLPPAICGSVTHATTTLANFLSSFSQTMSQRSLEHWPRRTYCYDSCSSEISAYVSNQDQYDPRESKLHGSF
jgi:hypothetical protein